MEKPKISVIIPIYNAEKYLAECLESVTKQTFKYLEIICVNDGSTDKTSDILKEYQKKDKRIIVLNQSNQGVNAARIAGYRKACGKYVAWVDADDFIEPGMYEKMISLAEEKDKDVVICNYNFYPGKIYRKEKWYKPYEGEIDWKFLSKNTIQWNKIVKKDLLDRLNIIELFKEVGEGCYTFVLISAKAPATIDEPLYNYRVGHSSLSSSFHDIEWYKKTVERNKRQYSYAIKQNYDKYWLDYLFFQYLYYVLILLVVACYNGDRDVFIECRKIIKDEKLFSKENREYLKEYISVAKVFYFKTIGIHSFATTRLISRKVLK